MKKGKKHIITVEFHAKCIDNSSDLILDSGTIVEIDSVEKNTVIFFDTYHPNKKFSTTVREFEEKSIQTNAK